jgi:TonB family protein
LQVFIRRSGSVCAVRIVRAGSSEFDGAIVKAVRQWQFAPAKEKGVAVDCVYEITVKINVA